MSQQSHYRAIYIEKTITEKDTCMPVFTAALFTTARTWKEPRCPLTDEWINRCGVCVCVYIYIKWKIAQPLKRNTFESVLMRWMNLELLI